MAGIRIYGDPVLRKTAEPLREFDDGLRQLVSSMFEDMRENEGVGLAAPQVGRSVRVAVIETGGDEGRSFVLVNPEITRVSDEKEEREEGCLSIPDINLSVTRPAEVSARACNENGEEYAIENATGLLARTLQHEIDHLDGILFVDRVSPVRRQLVSGKLKKLAKSHRATSKAT